MPNPRISKRQPAAKCAVGSQTPPRSIILACDWFDQRIYEGVFRFAKERDWHISPYLISDRHVPRGWPGDGAITAFGKTLSKFILSLEIPRVELTVDPMPAPVPHVLVDNAEIGRLASEHFLERGFRRFAYYHWPGVPVNEVRRKAFRTALLEAGVSPDQIHDITQSPGRMLGVWDEHLAHLSSQLKALPRPIGVFAGMDNLGATLVEVCVRTGIHVPEEVAVLGVDNTEFLCEAMAVPLSSVETRLEELAYAAAARLEELMDGKIGPDAGPIVVTPKGVVTRRSTDILAVEHPAVLRALSFMKDQSHEPITLGDISAHAGISKRGLEQAFLKHLNETPAVALRRLRLDKAKALLTQTNEKIDAIAKNCGYSNSSNLSLALNRDTGHSPRGYRKAFSIRESALSQ